MTKKVIFLNGPPRSGKDEFVNTLIDSNIHFASLKMAGILGEMVLPLFSNVDEYLLYREEKKDVPLFDNPENGSMRDLLIALSEMTLKPIFGQSVLGKLAVKKINSIKTDIIIFDIGFNSEAEAILKDAQDCEFYLIRIHREGCNFDNDSREWITTPIKNTLDVYNNSTLHHWKEECRNVIKSI